MKVKRLHSTTRANAQTGAIVYRFPVALESGSGQQGEASAVYWSRAAVEPYPFDEEYLARLRARDRDTESHFVEYFHSLLRAKLRGDGYAESASGDIRQETLYRVLKAVYENRIQNAKSLRSFVYGVCERVEWEYDRGEWRNWHDDYEEFPEISDDRNPADGPARLAEMRKTVQWVLDKLPEKDRKILIAVFLEERDKDEICREFEVDRGYLRVLVHRALGTAKKYFSRGASS